MNEAYSHKCGKNASEASSVVLLLDWKGNASLRLQCVMRKMVVVQKNWITPPPILITLYSSIVSKRKMSDFFVDGLTENRKSLLPEHCSNSNIATKHYSKSDIERNEHCSKSIIESKHCSNAVLNRISRQRITRAFMNGVRRSPLQHKGLLQPLLFITKRNLNNFFE